MGLITYKHFDPDLSCYLSRPDEEGTSITGELTLGTWVWFGEKSEGVATGIISKWYETGGQRSYVLYKDANDKLVFSVSTDGTNVKYVDDNAANFETEKWFYVVGRFTPSNEIALFVNGTWYLETTGVPASLKDCTEAFEIARYNRSNYLHGNICHAFLSAYAIPDRFIEANYSHAKAMFMKQRG